MTTLGRALGIAFLSASLAHAAGVEINGSADFETAHRGAAPTTGKIYALGKRIRSDSSHGAKPITVIMDSDAKKMWLIPSPTTCIEQSLSDDARRTSFLVPDPSSKEELVGTETIDGHPSEKYKVTTAGGTSALVHYVWRAKDLQGFPVKASDAAGTSETHFKNIVLAKPDAKLFQPPADCKSMPSMKELQERLQKMRPAAAPTAAK